MRSSSAFSSGLSAGSPKRSKAACAASSSVRWRALVIGGEAALASARPAALACNAATSRSIPSPVLAEISIRAWAALHARRIDLVHRCEICVSTPLIAARLRASMSGGDSHTGAVASTSHSTRSASSTRANARLIPSASTLPRASRIPAVSTRITGMPPRSRCTSMTSRVVPASSDTIATSRLASAFSSDDLPALGGPAMTMRKPSRRRSPRWSARWRAIDARKPTRRWRRP